MKDLFARAIAGLALGGTFVLYSYRDHGGWHAFDIAMALFWTAVGIYYLILDLFGPKGK